MTGGGGPVAERNDVLAKACRELVAARHALVTLGRTERLPVEVAA